MTAKVLDVTAPALKGIQQAKILRTMLQLPSFTRKELADEAGVEIQLVNAVVIRQKQLLRILEQRHSGGRGAPEEILALRADARETLVHELRPLYKELQSEWNSSHELSSYFPPSLEFRVAQESIERFDIGDSSTNPRRQMTAPDVRRTVELLGTVSRREGVPIEAKLGGQAVLEHGLNDHQQVARARIDTLKAKLCWLVTGSSDRAMEDLFEDAPIAAGAVYLREAVTGLRNHKIEADANSLELWSLKQIWSSVLNSFASPWASQTLDALARVDLSPLPRLSAEVMTVLKPSPSQIAEGLMTAYDCFYESQDEEALAFLDIRPFASTFAIMENKKPYLQLYRATPREGTKDSALSYKDAAEQLKEGLIFYKQNIGKHIGSVLLAGEGSKNAEFEALIHKLLPGVRVQAMDLPTINTQDESLAPYAAEIGLAAKASASSDSVKELYRSVIEQRINVAANTYAR